MKIQLGLFPAVYFSSKCTKHNCWVEIHVSTTKDRPDQADIAGKIISVKCQEGGVAKVGSCADHWVINISGPGNITIS